MNAYTVCKHRPLTLQFELGLFEPDKKLAFVESVCGVLNESRFGPGWRKPEQIADGGERLACRPSVPRNTLTFNCGCQNRLGKRAPLASESFVQNYNFAGEDYFSQRRTHCSDAAKQTTRQRRTQKYVRGIRVRKRFGLGRVLRCDAAKIFKHIKNLKGVVHITERSRDLHALYHIPDFEQRFAGNCDTFFTGCFFVFI